MTGVKSVNFYDLCRICTATTEEKIDIFSQEGKTKNLCAQMNECLPLNVDEKDRLPKVVCPQCIHHLESYMEFRNICRNSQIMLNSCLNTASAQNGGKVLIKDILSSAGKSLSVLNNSSNSLNINNNVSNMENLQNLSNQPLNQSFASQLPQQLFTIQGTNVMGQSVVSSNQELLNSIIQAVGIQNDLKSEKANTVPQYTITVDNGSAQQQGPMQTNSHPVTLEKDKESKNTLEEFLKMKPNIKVTPISKKSQQNQMQQQVQQQQPQEQQQFQQQELQQQQLHLQHQHQEQQQQLVQFQLQQLLQQQLQQQQLQQQLQLLTSHLQPQQITITAPAFQHQAPSILQPSTLTSDNMLNDSSDELSPPKNKKAKINFVLAQPNQTTNQTINSTLPQLTPAPTTPNATQPAAPQIQLQFQPTLTPQTSLQLQQTQQQQQQNAATAALLSNLAPLLQPQTQLNAALQTQTLTNVAQNSSTNMLSPNKCYLPITIKDESTDQQFVAHIDAKNFLLPTTYQLQMKLQPQIATADGQPIMQLAPTSIPATLQLAPQAINANPTFQATAAVAAFNSNSTLPSQLMQQQTQPLQTTQSQQPILQHITTTQQQPQAQPQAAPAPLPTQPSHISQLPKNLQITSQQMISTGNKSISSTLSTAADGINSNDREKSLPKVATKVSQTAGVTSANKNIIKQQKYKISQQPGSNTIEITPTTTFTQQIMQQVQQQQQQKQKMNQQTSSAESATTTTVTTQHGGITVQRITTKIPSTATSTGNGTNENVAQSTRQATITPLHQQIKQQTVTLPKLPILNKQNITISRIMPQHQQQPTKTQTQQSQQQQPTSQVASNTTLKVVQQPIKSEAITTAVTEQHQQALPNGRQQQQPASQQQPQIISNIANTTLRISPVKKIIKKPQQKAIENSQITTTNANQEQPSGSLAAVSANSATQIQYVTDISSILPMSNDAADTKISMVTTPSTTTISSTNTTNGSNSCQTKNNLECIQCGRVFKKKEHLTQHVKLHSGVRPFKCSEEGCTKAFHRKEHLLRHLVSHSGKKMFSCDICQKPFSRKDNLSKHRKIHTDPSSNNYVCEFCNKSFAVKTYYEQHKMLHQTKATEEEDKSIVDEKQTKTLNQSNGKNCSTHKVENVMQSQLQEQKIVKQTQQSTQQQQHLSQHRQQQQQQQQTQQHQQQLHVVQQQIQQLQQQNQAQSQQIMHLQLPTSIVTTQDMAGNTITITQANDPPPNSLKTLTISGSTSGGGNHHDATVLNLPTSLGNFVQLSQAQFVNATTGQIMGLKIQK